MVLLYASLFMKYCRVILNGMSSCLLLFHMCGLRQCFQEDPYLTPNKAVGN